ncbi:MAG: acylphosphatase [Thaumarchaeota archaeon]|nr:acylphosphatase [Candidatus Calditenuaceae archaeon]MDW8187435.1 acylphosphatase [Nitrososphaerota archaeon]
MTKLVRAHVWISGRVQGVFFRAHMKRVADDLGLRGWVRNLSDGRVEAVFEGPESSVLKAVEWCKKGPPMAVVKEVEVKWEEYTGSESRFYVRQ